MGTCLGVVVEAEDSTDIRSWEDSCSTVVGADGSSWVCTRVLACRVDPNRNHHHNRNGIVVALTAVDNRTRNGHSNRCSSGLVLAALHRSHTAIVAHSGTLD